MPRRVAVRNPADNLATTYVWGETNASGIALPGAVAGWTQVLADDFDTAFSVGAVNGTTGAFPSPYASKLFAFADGTFDTAHSTNDPPGSVGIYQPSTVVSAANSTLKVDPFVSGGVPKAAAVVVLNPTSGWGQSYGRFSVCARIVTANTGWKLAWLLWPDSESWPNDGEIDFPEGSLTGTVTGNTHHSGADSIDDYDHFESGSAYGSGWRVYTIEWAPGWVRYYLDGVVVGTSWAAIPSNPMHWILQTETDYKIAQPTLGAAIEIDWVSVWELGSFTVPAAAKTDTLVDTFTTLDTAKWATLGGTISSGQLSLPVNTGYTGSLASVERFDLTSSSLSLKLTQATGNTSVQTWMSLNDTTVNMPSSGATSTTTKPSRGVGFRIDAGLLVMRWTTGGADNDTSLTYSSTTHAWLRLRCDATNVYWDTAPDGTTWTNRRTVTLATIGWTPDKVQLTVGTGYWNAAGGTPTAVLVDNVNA